MRMKMLPPLFVMALLILAALTSTAAAQDKLRYVEVEKLDGLATAPLEIAEIHVGDKMLSGGRLSARSDWLKELKITVKNISEKNITRVLLMAVVSGEGSTYWKFRTQFQLFGESPFPKPDQKRSPVLKPGESAIIKIDPKTVDGLMQQFAKHDIFDTDSVVIEFAEVMFDDNSGYARGRKICRVPGKRGASISVSSNTICPTN